MGYGEGRTVNGRERAWRDGKGGGGGSGGGEMRVEMREAVVAMTDR